MEGVLLLNSSFEPLGVISWKKAVCLFFSGKAEVIEEYERQIRSVSVIINAPAVVRLLKYVRLGRRKPPLSRTNILARDKLICQYCSLELSSKEATIDHIIPRSRGGDGSWKNLVCCCKKCNIKKGSKTLREANMQLIKAPFVPDWLPVLQLKFNGKLPILWKGFIRSKKKTD